MSDACVAINHFDSHVRDTLAQGRPFDSHVRDTLAQGRLEAENWELETSSLRHLLLRLALLDHAQEGIDQRRVELASALALDLRDGFGDRPCRLVGALLCERVEHI